MYRHSITFLPHVYTLLGKTVDIYRLKEKAPYPKVVRPNPRLMPVPYSFFFAQYVLGNRAKHLREHPPSDCFFVGVRKTGKEDEAFQVVVLLPPLFLIEGDPFPPTHVGPATLVEQGSINGPFVGPPELLRTQRNKRVLVG